MSTAWLSAARRFATPLLLLLLAAPAWHCGFSAGDEDEAGLGLLPEGIDPADPSGVAGIGGDPTVAPVAGTETAGTTGTTGTAGTNDQTDPPAPGTCYPGTYACNGAELLTCIADGVTWEPVETCDTAPECNSVDGDCGCEGSCEYAECGDNGCGGTCGTCGGDLICDEGWCEEPGVGGEEGGIDAEGGSGGESGTCVPQCAGKACGDDGCGGSCGSCPGGTECESNGTCVVATPAECVVNGTGNQVGDQVKNIVWTDSNSQNLELHSFCGNTEAIVAIEVAGW